MNGFGISEDDVIAVALRRGVDLSDEQAGLWFEKLDHGLIEIAALQVDDMDEQTNLAFDAIDSQLDELGCWNPRKAEMAAQSLGEETPVSVAVRSNRI